MKTKMYTFRPSARLMHTIGENIIKDVYAAVIELIKNSYDADATNVLLKFENMYDFEKSKIVISDNGHGMTHDIVINKWMIPATSDKVERRISNKGRLMLGRKGIGRFAAQILGENLLMETTDTKGNTTTIFIDWSIFTDKKFLDEIEILVETNHTGKSAGTELTIDTGKLNKEWTDELYDNLIKELRKLISPHFKKESFNILCEFINTGIERYNNQKFNIEPFPLFELYDYRLTGSIDDKGRASLTYINQIDKKQVSGKIKKQILPDSGKFPGPLTFDFRVFDRDPEAITELIGRGLKDSQTGEFLDKKEAKRQLDEFCGISIYRNDFRIRPYGEPGYDWLELDKARVQNPTKKIGVNQIAGFITISEEEISHLEEKSARDGLKENNYYTGLKNIICEVLNELEERRLQYRIKTGRGRKKIKIQKELESLFDFNALKTNIEKQLKKAKVSTKYTTDILKYIDRIQQEKLGLLENIQEAISIYQGQVTLGKIIMVLMHEGRNPLKYLTEQAPRITEWIEELKQSYKKDLLDKILDRLYDIVNQSYLLIELFNRLEPLAVRRKGAKKNININTIIEKIRILFNNEMKKNKITFENKINKNLTFSGWDQDLYIAATNLIENSIYWLIQNKNNQSKKIVISSEIDEKIISLIFFDNGPGISKKYIDDNSIFEPGFSTKIKGTGLGLAIAGEAIERNGGNLLAIYNPNGAYLKIELPAGEKI